MPNQTELLLDLIMKDVTAPICTRCLTSMAGVSNEKRGRQICRNLRDEGWIQRGPGQCRRCGVQFPQINFPLPVEKLPANSRSPASQVSDDHTWHWEGHVQDSLLDYLRGQGWTIVSFADTASHERGKDIVASSLDGEEMWVSVKGYPESRPGKRTSPSTQARHWFSMAIFDMVQYRQENVHVQLALAFPNGFTAYLNYIKRVQWLKEATPFKVYWVAENGTVIVE